MSSDKDAREYLTSKGVPPMIDHMIMSMLEQRPDDHVAFMKEYLDTNGSMGSRAVKCARPNKGGKPSKPPVNWSKIAACLPTGRDNESKMKRNQMFDDFDPNGNGYLSLAEVDKGLRDIAQLDCIFNAKPAIMRAFQAAKDVHKDTKARLGHDFVTRCEFRILLVYLKRYFELWIMYQDIDGDSDRRLSYEEFEASIPEIEKWGFKVYYPDQTFKVLDKNGGGMVLFDEFAEWAISRSLELEDVTRDDDDKVWEDMKEEGSNGGSADRSMKMTKSSRPPKSSFRRGRTSDIDWTLISKKLPAGRNSVDVAKRKELFRLFDVNGNGYLSLAEVDKAVRDILCLEDLFDCKPAMMRAFQAAKNYDKKSRARLGEDFVTKSEFRILLMYLRKYFELFVMFDRIDGDGDRRLTLQEFSAATAKLATWGVKISDPATEFKSIDRNGGGFVLFQEFCNWAVPKGLDAEDDDNYEYDA